MTATKQQIIDAIENGITNAPKQGVPEWLGATDSLINLLVTEGECFSSGEIAAHLRTFRPDLRFSVTTNVGEHVRDRFYSNTLPLYPNADGTHTPVEMVPRRTGGFTRTPPGTEVFVYGPSYTDANSHDFEVEIPKPGTQVQPEPVDGLPPIPKQAPAPVQHFTNLKPRKARTDLRASVHNDGRCCVPRSAFEELLHSTGSSLKGGDSVYVAIDDANEQIVVSLNTLTNARTYSLQATRGRILVPHPSSPFTPGDAYSISVDNDKLIVDLSQTV